MSALSRRLPLLALLPVAALAGATWWATRPAPVRLQGQIEAQSYSVASKIPGRIDRVLVKKGDPLQQGALVFRLTSPELDAKMQQAQAGEAAASALARNVELGAREQQVLAAKDQWRRAQAAADLHKTTYQRLDALFEEGVLAEQKRDEALTQWRTSQLAADAAQQQYLLAQEGAREEQKQAAREQAKRAAGAVAEVAAYQAETEVRSPASGEVSQVLLQPGELAPQGFPVVTLLDMHDAWLRLQVREDRLKHFPMGQEFEVRLPAIDDQPHRFRVSHIAVMGEYATWRATDSGSGFDMRSFEVEARPLEADLPLRVGMSGLVSLDAD